MWGYWLKSTLRNVMRNKAFALINIVGLALGLACAFIILIYIWHESNYDQFHDEQENLYRIEYRISLGQEINASRIPPTIGPALETYVPSLSAATRFYPRNISAQNPEDDQQFELEDVFFVDSTALSVFDFEFVEGDPVTSLHAPNSVILTEETAIRLFGIDDPIGRTIRLAGVNGFNVSAVVKAWPENSHLAFSMLVPFEAMVSIEPEYAREITRNILENNWIATHSYTYVRMKSGHQVEEVNAQLKNLILERGHETVRNQQSFYLMPVKDLHLKSQGGPKPPGNLSYLYLFGSIGILTLLVACINFVNLYTADSLSRSKTVGVRKVLGAGRTTLILQFLGESMAITFLAFIIALTLAISFLPLLNQITHLTIPDSIFLELPLLLMIGGIVLMTGLLAGLYPAFFISNFRPVIVLSGSSVGEPKSPGAWLRKGLITFQFLAALSFISGTMIVYLQLKYLRTQPLGFNKDLMLEIPLYSDNNMNASFRPGDAAQREKMNAFDASLQEHPDILAVTQSSSPPGLGGIARNVYNEHVRQEDNFFPQILAVDYDYAETFDLQVIAGRDFDPSYGTDHISSFLINETAVHPLGYANPEEAVGKQVTLEGKEGMIVGVLRDFHFNSLREQIQPLLLEVRPGAFGTFSVRIANRSLGQTIAFLEKQWRSFFPEKVFEYTFLDESIDELYASEQRLATMISYFAFVAILISCIGLFGLSALATRQRFREIGIRKVLGATSLHILQLLIKDFAFLILASFVIATPITWYLLRNWLAEFAYRIEFPWWIFPMSGLVVLVVACLTISSQSLKAALSNPVESLRNE